MYNFDNIVNELLYRIRTNTPDFKNEKHLEILINILNENKWPSDVIISIIKNLMLLSELSSNTIEHIKKVDLRRGYFGKWIDPKTGKLITKLSPNEKKIIKTFNKDGIKQNKFSQSQTESISKKVVNKNASVKIGVDRKYIPSEKDKKIVDKSLSVISVKSSMLASPADVNLLSDFKGDIGQLMNTQSNELARAIVDKYKLKINKDAELGTISKLYIGAIDKKYRKIFSGVHGNQASTIIAQILKDTGALNKHVGFIKKSMTPNKIFTDSETLNVKKINNGIQIGNIIIRYAKKYDYNKINKLFKDKGMSSDDANDKTLELKTRVKRHNFILDNIESILGASSLNVLKPCSECDVSTPQGRENIKRITIKKIISKMLSLAGDTKTKNIKNIIDNFNKLNEINDKKIYQLKLNDILFEFSTNKITTATSADFTELIDYLRVLNNGSPAYLPKDSKFALGDILQFPLKQPTIKEIMAAENLSSIFSTLEDRSVKKGTGCASTSKGKILLTKFKNKNIQSDLLKITNSYDSLINKGDIKFADKLINELEIKYSSLLESDLNYIKRIKNKDKWIKTFSNKLNVPDRWDRYYKLGYIMQTIYNDNIKFQGFQNSKYSVKKNSVEHDLSDGVNVVAKLGYEPSMIGPTGKPLTPYPTRFHHKKYN